MSYMSKSVTAVVGLVVMAIVFSRQLFLFVASRDPQGILDSQGGRYHLWLAITAAAFACIAGALMIHSFNCFERNKWSKIPTVPSGVLLTSNSDNQQSDSAVPTPFDAIRGARLDMVLEEGQANDRRPMHGTVADDGGTPSAQRTLARGSHQLMFKKWSQARHD